MAASESPVAASRWHRFDCEAPAYQAQVEGHRQLGPLLCLPAAALVLAAPSFPILLPYHASLAVQIPFLFLAGAAGLAHRMLRLRNGVRFSSVEILIVVVALVEVGAFLLSPFGQLMGSEVSYRGLLPQLAAVIILFLGWEIGRSAGMASRIGTLAVLGGVPVVLYSVIRHIGLDWIIWEGGARSEAGFSTLGGPNDYAAYLLLLLPWTWYLASSPHRVIVRLAAAAFAGVVVVTVITTGSRTGVVIVTIMLLYFGSVTYSQSGLARHGLLRSPTGGLARIAIVALGVAAIGIIYLAVHLSPKVTIWLAALYWRPPDMYYPVDISVAGRLELWATGLSVVTERLPLGYGQDSIPFVLGMATSSETIGGGRLATWVVTSLHNALLDKLVTTGMVGLLAQLLLVVGIVRLVSGKCRVLSRSDRILVYFVGVGAILFLAHSLFHPVHIINEALLWLVIGLVCGVVTSGSSGGSTSERFGERKGTAGSRESDGRCPIDGNRRYADGIALLVTLTAATLTLAGYILFQSPWPKPLGVPGPLPQPAPYPVAYVPMISDFALGGARTVAALAFYATQFTIFLLSGIFAYRWTLLRVDRHGGKHLA